MKHERGPWWGKSPPRVSLRSQAVDGWDLPRFVSLFPREGSAHLKPDLPKASPSVIWSSAVGPE